MRHVWPVDPKEFARRMEQRWVNELGNTSNPILRATWEQMCAEFNYAIARTATGETGTWRVLCPETGTGKSEGVVLYCSMLSPVEMAGRSPVGVLIVQPLIKQAKRIARRINKTAGDVRAIAVHHKAKYDPAEIAQKQIVVVTHKSFLDKLYASGVYKAVGGAVADRRTLAHARQWSALHEWGSRGRELTIIDEQPELIRTTTARVAQFRVLRAAPPPDFWESFPDAEYMLDMLIEWMEKHEKRMRLERENGCAQNQIVWTMSLGRALFQPEHPDHELCSAARFFFRETDLTAFRAKLKEDNVRTYTQKGEGSDPAKEERTSLGEIAEKMFLFSQTFIHQSAKKDGKHNEELFSCGACIIPSMTPPAVVLDATAELSPIYPLFPDKVEIVPRKGECRTYRKVTLHVGRLKGLGKATTRETMERRFPQLANALRRALVSTGGSPDREVLVVTHKCARKTAKASKDSTWTIRHWNGLHGSNRFQNVSVVAFYSLLYPSKLRSELEVHTARDPMTPPPSGDDMQQRVVQMEYQKIAGALVQTLSRGRCRRVVNSKGDCDEMDVPLPLPHGKPGNEILKLVKKQMPGVNVVDWDLRGVDGASTEREGPLNVAGKVADVMVQMSPGKEITTRTLEAHNWCSPRMLRKVLKKIDDPKTRLGQLAITLGIVRRRGRIVRLARRQSA